MHRIRPAAVAAALLLCTSADPAAGQHGPTGGLGDQAATPAATAPDRIPVELYIMSKCPYGAQTAVPMIDAREQLGGAMDLRIEYIGRDEGGELRSLHGFSEIRGNIDQLCARAQDPVKAYAFIRCVSADFVAIPENSAACAELVRLDGQVLRECAEGEQGRTLLRESFARASAAGAVGSPTMKIAGQPYRGGRDTLAILRAVCAQIKLPHAVCAAIPPPALVRMIALTDARCAECQTARYETQLKTYFPGLEVEHMEWGTEQGQAIFKNAGLRRLPALLFDDSVLAGEGYPQFEKRFQQLGAYWSLPIKAFFDPYAEICDNQLDDNGDRKVDCADPTCKESLVCRPERKGELRLFIMAHCPYAMQALGALKPVLERLGHQVKLKIHYIADQTETGFRSLHGQAEVEEDIRQLCAARKYPTKYLNYLWCRSKDFRNADWQQCASGGIDAQVIRNCAEGKEGQALLAADIKIAEGLQISASPTWIANNRYKFSGNRSEQIRSGWCKHNPGVKGCAAPLPDAAPPPGAADGCPK